MKTKFKMFMAMSLALVVVLSLAGCGNSKGVPNNHPILGKWYAGNNLNLVELHFFSDGKFREESTWNNPTNAKYKIKDDVLTLYDDEGNEDVFTFSISDGVLFLVDKDGEESKFERTSYRDKKD